MEGGVSGHSTHSVTPHVIQDINKKQEPVTIHHHNTEVKIVLEMPLI